MSFEFKRGGEPQKTVKVRIALVVDDKGNWGASGWNLTDVSAREVDMQENAHLNAGEPYDPYVEHWITAEVPVPEATEIAGEVERAQREAS